MRHVFVLKSSLRFSFGGDFFFGKDFFVLAGSPFDETAVFAKSRNRDQLVTDKIGPSCGRAERRRGASQLSPPPPPRTTAAAAQQGNAR